MELFIALLVVFVALEHLAFLYLEMFLWTKTFGRKVFGNTKEEAERTKVLAANQGLYNGFLSAGLLWGVVHPNDEVGLQITLFFLTCIVVAGIYGGVTVKRSVFYIQSLPAIMTIVMIYVR